jgi:hypothetical protein
LVHRTADIRTKNKVLCCLKDAKKFRYFGKFSERNGKGLWEKTEGWGEDCLKSPCRDFL